VHGYAFIHDRQVSFEPLQFAKAPIKGEDFDLGIDPTGRVLICYGLPQKFCNTTAEV
jgi:hypothetical protein